MVSHIKLRPGFSHDQSTWLSWQCKMRSQVNAYNLLAMATRDLRGSDNVGKPLGKRSVLATGGFARPLRWIKRALEAVPQGGAKCAYTQKGELKRLLMMEMFDASVKSKGKVGLLKRGCRVWSTPTLSLSPKARMQAVSRPVPLKISMQKNWLRVLPLTLFKNGWSVRPLVASELCWVKLGVCQDCVC